MRMRLMVALLAQASLLLASCTPVAPATDEGSIPRQCGLDAARSLIGTHVGAVSFPQGANVRIVCTTCPTTKDLRPDRLNVRFVESTGIIESVDCG